MTIVNKQGYIERRTVSGKNNSSMATKRNWWLIKSNPIVTLGTIYLGQEYVGKKVVFKIEILEDKK